MHRKNRIEDNASTTDVNNATQGATLRIRLN